MLDQRHMRLCLLRCCVKQLSALYKPMLVFVVFSDEGAVAPRLSAAHKNASPVPFEKKSLSQANINELTCSQLAVPYDTCTVFHHIHLHALTALSGWESTQVATTMNKDHKSENSRKAPL